MPAASHPSAPAAVPASLPFPRAPFTAALKDHARLLDGALEELAAIVREYDGDLDVRVHLLCAHVEVGPDRRRQLGTQPRMMEASEFPLHAALQDGLRWLDRRADRTKPHAAPEVTLEKARSREASEASGAIDPELAALEKELADDALEPDPEPVDDRPLRSQTGPRLPLSTADAIDRVMIDGYWMEIEDVLEMAPEELDAEITRAGFDAAEERRRGFMLREEVLAAVVRGRDAEGERG